jgi:uncharacterized glyoxalase superfamily protein PhnB
MKLPPPVPELPVSDLRTAADAYAQQMDFRIDWMYEDSLAGISKDAARIFLRRRTPKETREVQTATIWLNMASPAEVDQLYADWKGRGVSMVEEVQTTAYHLRQFVARDVDGNTLRVFFDLGTGRPPEG